TFRLSRLEPPPGPLHSGWVPKAIRRACRNVRMREKVRCKRHGTDLGVGVDLQSLRHRGVESRNLRDVVVLPLSLFYLQLKGVPWTGPFWISFIRWVVKLEILLCSRFEVGRPPYGVPWISVVSPSEARGGSGGGKRRGGGVMGRRRRAGRKAARWAGGGDVEG
ncbi:hypothetical protein B0H14DRAFT_2999581, partial [Mycena olivaceomarginata]